MTGLLCESRTEWDDWLASLILAGPERGARQVPCRSCGGRWKEPCIAATGLMASGPCEVRMADAARLHERAGTGAA